MEDEVIITSDNIFSIFNANGGPPIATYEKVNNISKKTLAVIKDSVFIGAKENKPIVEAWKICKAPDEMECGRQTCAGIVSCIIIDKSSSVGVVSFEGDNFKLYVWNIESGIFVIVEKQFLML
ncbi:hypothetical protein CEXT_398191 [Caerostris extrusa]|uniref:Uncharacterized protein n=1 Tax=Caerostris extrusa TaxID=172846 RepID=A0AAV4NIY8_CAEEX|nr:hypothetical protein CEXT_398191 [Caerostris extrusa]